MSVALRLRNAKPLLRTLHRHIGGSRRQFSSGDGGGSGTKFVEILTEEFEVGNRLIKFETGKYGRFANGAVVLNMEDTKILSTVNSSRDEIARNDFLPLTVDYEEKQFAHGLIPSTYMRREGAPKERELLCARIIDRPIRPLFPRGFYHEVQVTASVLSSDGIQDPIVFATNAVSAALMLSDIPWGGPIGMIRIGRICGQFVVNPTMDELSVSDLNLIYACTKDKTLMIDVQAREISHKDLQTGLRFAHPEAVKYIEPQIRLAAKAGKSKKEYKLSMFSDKTLEKVSNLAEAPIKAVFTDPSYGKFERGKALDNITQDVKKVLEEEGDEESIKVLPKTIDTVRKKVVRKRIIAEGSRVDGRQLDEVRPLYCEAGCISKLRGTADFFRGETQVLCTVTLGAPKDAQHLDSLVGPSSKRFMLHYSFPPYCIGEVGKRGGLNRREVGHGALAEKAILAVLPPEDVFPYTVRVNSEVMASDGSTSMASVCGASMALMDAGIPLREHVAGISVGLVSELDTCTGEIADYRILTDILGLEDHLGDIDFKIAGTRKGITAAQLDMKPAGIPLDIICECLEPAHKAHLHIIDHMEREIKEPRTKEGSSSQQLVTLKYSNDALRRLIGPMGVLLKKLEMDTGARMSVGDGTLTIVAKNQSVMDKALEKFGREVSKAWPRMVPPRNRTQVVSIVGREIEIGGIYKGVVTSIKEYGAFVEFNGGKQGLLHISELSHEPVSKISDVVSIGQQLSLMCIGQDVHGNIKLSLKEALRGPGGSQTNYIAEGSAASTKVTANVWAPVFDMSSITEEQNPASKLPIEKNEVAETKPSASQTPVIVIRSAAECDEEEKSISSDHNQTSNGPLIGDGVKLDSKSKSASKSKPRKSQDAIDSPSQSGPSPDNNAKKPKLSMQKESKSDTQRAEGNEKKGKDNEPSTAKDMRLGTKVNAKVYQIRAHGLVLDLGGGVRGMYRFEKDGKTDFKIGDEMRVVLSSFSRMGIPVVSVVDDK